MNKKIVFLLLAFFITGCGHTGKEHSRFVNFIKEGNYSAAEQLTQDEDFYMDEASLLVRYFELGSLHYLKGEYYQALQNFDKAHDLAEKLYTISISKSVLSEMAGDGLAPYRGEKYELSLLRFYQSLTHYKLYEQGYYESYKIKEGDQEIQIEQKDLSESEKRMHFNAARASILDWNSLLTTYKNETKDPESFHQDMLAKTFGAEIHDIYATTGDRQIARQLYKDTEKLLDSVYKNYPSYDEKNTNQLKKYAKHKGKDLYAAAAEKENVKIVLKTGLITPKTAEKVDFIIPIGVFLAAGSGNEIVSCLGTILPGQKISFEIPAVSQPEKVKEYTLVVKDKMDKKILSVPMVLTAPVSETAYKEYQYNRSGIIAEKSARLASKYAAAVVSACALYDPDNILKLLGAYAAFAGSAKLIEATEYADIRYWGLLPHAIFQQSVKLKKGAYRAEILSEGKSIKSFTFDVKDARPILIDLNIPNG